MTVAFVLGNGQSRAALDLQRFKSLGSIYGCNGLYRDFEPDCLVATDRPIAEAIQRSGYSKNHRFYTRKPLEDMGSNNPPPNGALIIGGLFALIQLTTASCISRSTSAIKTPLR